MSDIENFNEADFSAIGKKGSSGFSLAQGFDWYKLRATIFKSKWLIVFLILFTSTGGYFFVRYTKPVYESNSVLKLDVKSDANLLGLTVNENANKNFRDISGEIEIIRSKLISEKVIKLLALDVSYYEKGNLLYDEKYNSHCFDVEFKKGNNKILYDSPVSVTIKDYKTYVLRYTNEKIGKEFEREFKFGEEVNLFGFSFNILPNLGFSSKNFDIEYFFIVHSAGALNQYFQSNLSVGILNLSANTINITFKDNNQYKARDIVNAVDTIYLVETLQKKSKAQQQQIGYIDQQLANTEKKLKDAEKLLEEFVKSSKTPNPAEQFSKLASRVEELQDQIRALEYKGELLGELKEVIKRNQKFDKYFPVIEGIGNEQLRMSIKNLNALLQEFEKVSRKSKPTTAIYADKENELRKMKISVLDFIERSETLNENQINHLENKLKEAKDIFLDLPSKETELTRLKRQYNLYEKFFMVLKEKRVEYDLAKAGTVPAFVILSRASLALQPIYPEKGLIYAFSILLGMVLSTSIVVVRFLMQNTIVNQKDLENLTNVAVLGVVPKYTKKKLEYSKLVIGINPKAAISEALRSIRTNIDFISSNKQKLVITTTSTYSGEGKTFVTINLGGVISLSNKKVIVLDLDMRKPKVHIGFDAENTIGMSNILINNASLEECIKKSQLENLHFISAGPPPPNPSELILNNRFEEIIEALKRQYDVIMIDTPPVGIVTDGLLVMKKADIQLYIARAEYSKKNIRHHINDLHSSGHFNNLALILNSVSQSSNYGYRTGGYGYGYYSDDATSKKKVRKLFAK